MSGKQVGWYDGERVHQMNARPVGDVPQHLAHTAGWKSVVVAIDCEVEEIATPTLNPAALAEAQKFGDGMPVLPPPLQAEAAAIGACCDPMSLEVGDPA